MTSMELIIMFLLDIFDDILIFILIGISIPLKCISQSMFEETSLFVQVIL